MQYYCKIDVKYTPQIINETREIEWPDDYLTTNDLKKYIKENEKFSLYIKVDEENWTGNIIMIEICSERLETEQELQKRIKKEETYNKNYELFHLKYDKQYKNKKGNK